MPSTQHTKLILHFALKDVNNFGSLFYEKICLFHVMRCGLANFFLVGHNGGMFWQTVTPESLGCVTIKFGVKEIPLPKPIK